MKKFMWVFLFLLFLGIPTLTQAQIKIQKGRTAYYYYDEQNTKRDFILYQNSETSMPVFMINFKGTPTGQALEEIDISEVPLHEEDIQWLKDVITIIMDGKSYPEVTSKTLVGIQVLLWELWSEKMNDPIRYSFLVSYALNDYKNKVKELQSTYFTPIHYSYKGKVNEKIQTSFVPNFLEEYNLKPIGDAPKVTNEGNTFWFTAQEAGDYEYLVDSSYFDEQVHFYKEGDILFIELSKPKEKPIYLDYHVEEDTIPYEVHVLPSEGVTSTMKINYQEGEIVPISYDLDENYEVLAMDAYTSSGKTLQIQNNTFVMPKENVILQIRTRKIPTYNIFVVDKEGVTFEIEKWVKAREMVEVHYALKEHYHLKNLKVTTMSGIEVLLENNRFIMPEENVILSYDVEKDEEPRLYEVYVQSEEGSRIFLEKNTFLEGETVFFTYNLESGYQLDEITVTTLDGKVLSIQDHSFAMPNTSVILRIKSSIIPEEPSYSVFIPQKKGITFQNMSTYKEGEKVSLKYTIDPSFRFTSLKIYTVSGKEVPLENNSFIMPSESVIVLYEVEICPFSRIFLIPNEHVEASVSKNSFKVGEDVTLHYEVENGFLLDSIHVYTISGNEVPLKNLTFSMPSDDVVVEFMVKEKVDMVEDLTEPLQKEEIQTYDVPNTSKNSLLPVLILGLLLVFLFFKIYF